MIKEVIKIKMETITMMESSIGKWGNSSAIRIPKNMLKDIGLNENSKVRISTHVLGDKKSIVIEPIEIEKKRKGIRQRVEDFYGLPFEQAIEENPYTLEEVDFGGPVGEEIW